MDFRKWLLFSEHYGDSLNLFGNPPEADHYPRACRSARDFQIFRDRLNHSRKLGNPMINIDMDDLNSIPIISPESTTLPGDEPWCHKHHPAEKPTIHHKVVNRGPKS